MTCGYVDVIWSNCCSKGGNSKVSLASSANVYHSRIQCILYMQPEWIDILHMNSPQTMKIGTGPYSLFRRFFWIFGILSGSMGFYENPSDTVRSFGVCHISDNQKSLSVDPSQSLFYFVPQPSRLCYFSARTNRQNNYIHGVFLTDSQLGAPVRKFKTFYL